jgi:two-component system cell cycle sensor histidine kinase/response regulator CckA
MQDQVRTALVIEDDDAVRNLLRTLLRLAGCEVLSCRDGEEALDLMEARGGSLSLLISDIHLGGGMDGFAAAARLRARQPSLRALFLSGDDREEDAAGGPADHFLAKPFTPRAFADAVANLLRTLRADAVS